MKFARFARLLTLPVVVIAVASLLTVIAPPETWALASNNIPLDSPVYLYLEKLAGFGLIKSDVKGIKPYSRAEAARLLLEAEESMAGLDGEALTVASGFAGRLRELLPREASLREEPAAAPLFDYNLIANARLRYVYLDGTPRDFNRDVRDPANQSAFGFIGGNLRPLPSGIVHTTGTEGTPLLENNEGVIYRRGNNAELRWSAEGFVTSWASLLVEPLALATPESSRLALQKGYAKIGGGGLELEAGRDANWFGPGFRGTTTLTNNAKNFDLVKLSSPEPLDVGWVKKYLGDFKYSFILSRFDETGTGTELRRPYFLGLKLALKPKPWFEIGGNFIRQFGGPGFDNGGFDWYTVFGGGDNDHSNTIAGIDLRFRIPWLRNTEVYGEYSGEDSASFWPFVESYVAGFYIPRLTASGRDDLRFEYFWGSVMLYGDWQFPAGYVYHNMTPGHSQGTAAQDFFVRYSHWFTPRNNLALEYFHTDRGKYGKLPGQQTEQKNAWRGFWNLPLYDDMDMNLMYGWERINNLNLVGGKRTNQIARVDISYRY